jgi:glucose-1-phosphate adenylyltransferase
MDISPVLPRAELTRTMTVLLAGGQGSRLHELTARICKPALPLFSTHKGPLRMVDFTMANVVRAGLPRLIVSTQYRPETLGAHLDRRWAPLFPTSALAIRKGATVRGEGGYGGTADAVAANRTLIEQAAPDELLVLSGDHIYQMDYTAMIAAHRASGAMVTLAVHRVPVAQASAFGVVRRAAGGCIAGFTEKPPHPVADAGHPGEALVSMGVYVFDWAWLQARLPAEQSALDFGQDVLPAAVAEGVASAWLLPTLPGQTSAYWRDVGTLDSLRQTLLEFGAAAGPAHSDGPCNVPVLPGAPFRLTGMPDGSARGPVGVGVGVTDTVLLPGALAMPGARLARVIVAPGTLVPADLEVGFDAAEDARWFRRTDEGTTLITNAMLARRAGRVLAHLTGPLRRAFDMQIGALN